MATILERWRKKKHLGEKVLITKKKIWDLEFFMRQLQNEKESFRVEYDRIKEAIDAATLRLKTENEKPEPDKTIKDNLENLIAKYTPDLEKLKTHMQAIDVQIEGVNVQDPDAPEQTIHKQGVKEMIEQHRSLLGLLKEYRDKV